MKGRTVIHVPEPKFKSMDKYLDLMAIVEGKPCATIMYRNEEYLLSGARGTGTGRGWACIWAYPVIEEVVYKGNLTPLPYGLHFNEVTRGSRERSYTGMLITAKGKRKLVVLGPEIEFRPADAGQQLKLF